MGLPPSYISHENANSSRKKKFKRYGCGRYHTVNNHNGHVKNEFMQNRFKQTDFEVKRILDYHNNVEVIRIPIPVPGDYVIQIQATELVEPYQDVALVITGALNSNIVFLN